MENYGFVYLQNLLICFFVSLLILIFSTNLKTNFFSKLNLKLQNLKVGKFHLVPLIFFLIFLFTFSFLGITKHNNFHTYAYDLGVYTQALYNTFLGEPYATPLRGHNFNGDHQIPILLFLVLLFSVFKTALILIILQNLIIALTFFPLYNFAKKKLNALWGLIFCFIFLLYPPLHYLSLFDFHPDAFLIFFLFMAYYYLEKNNFKISVLFLFLAIYCKEQIALLGIIFSLLYFFKLKKRGAALIIFLFSLSWFYLTLFVIAPYFNPSGFLYFTMYNYLGQGLTAKIHTLLFSPLIPLKEIFTLVKVGSLTLFFLPLFFLPLISFSFIFALPTLFINHLANDLKVSSIFFQHSSPLIPFYFIGAILGIKKITQKYSSLKNTLPLTILGFNILFSFYFGALPFSLQFMNKNYTLGNFRSLKFNKEVYFPSAKQKKHYQKIYLALSLIPSKVDVVVCAQGNIFPHLVLRKKAYEFPKCKNATYIIVDKKGNTWPFPKENNKLYLQAVGNLYKNKNYKRIFFKDSVLVFKKINEAS